MGSGSSIERIQLNDRFDKGIGLQLLCQDTMNSLITRELKENYN